MNKSQKTNVRIFRNGSLIGIGGVAVALAALLGCGPQGNKSTVASVAAGPPRIETATVAIQNLTQKIEMSGTIEGNETVDLYAKVGGFLEEIAVDIGDRVTAGQLLARLSIPEMAKEIAHQEASVKSAEAMVQQAAAGIRQAEAQIISGEASIDEAKTLRSEKEAVHKLRQAEFARTKELVDGGSLLAKKLDEARFNLASAEAALKSVDARVRSTEADLAAMRANVDRTKQDFATAEAQVAVAVADLEKTKTMSEYGTIRAPFAGFVTKRMVDPGAFIQPAQGNSGAKPLLTVTDTSVVRLRLDLPMDEVQWLDRGDRAIFDRINALPGAKFEGTVTRYSSTLDPTSRTMRVEIDLPNPDFQLSPGFYGYVTLMLNEYKDVPTVPSSAIMTDDVGTFVYVVDDGTCRQQAVTISYADGTTVGLSAGLEGGETVVKSGGGQLSDGQQVNTATTIE